MGINKRMLAVGDCCFYNQYCHNGNRRRGLLVYFRIPRDLYVLLFICQKQAMYCLKKGGYHEDMAVIIGIIVFLIIWNTDIGKFIIGNLAKFIYSAIAIAVCMAIPIPVLNIILAIWVV